MYRLFFNRCVQVGCMSDLDRTFITKLLIWNFRIFPFGLVFPKKLSCPPLLFVILFISKYYLHLTLFCIFSRIPTGWVHDNDDILKSEEVGWPLTVIKYFWIIDNQKG